MGLWEVVLLPALGVLISTFLALLVLGASCQRRRKPGEPPLVNGWIPFLGVALDFKDDASNLLRTMQRKHGGVFTLRMAGKYITFITNPLQFGSLTKHGKYFTFDIISDQLASKVFNYPSILSGNFPNLNENVHRNYQYLQGKPLDMLSDSMMKNLQHVFEKRFACTADWKMEKMNKFCFAAMFEASFITLYGRNPNADDPNVVDAIGEKFTHFDAKFSYIVANIPIEVLGATKRIRKELIHYFLPKKMATWLEVSELIQARKDMFEMYEILRDYDKAAHHFAFMWASVGNTIPATFWATYHLLRHPEALAVVRDEIDHLLQSTGQERRPGCSIRLTREQLDNLVYLESAINEALRMCSSSMSMRFVKEDCIIKLEENQEVSLRKGDWIAIFPPILHMDPEVYEDPKTYKFDRYVENGKKKTTFYKQKNKLKYFLMPFGYGSSICPGRFFAMNEIKLFLVLFLAYFDVEIAEDKDVSVDKSRLGLGILLPESDIVFRYRLRP